MPIYQFQNPETGEVIELEFGMNDEKFYVDEDGSEWKRLFSHINFPSSAKSFNEDAPMFDKNGRPLKVHKITNEQVKQQGFDSVSDYIDFNNAVIDREKSPEANLQRAHDQANNKDLQQEVEHLSRENAKKAAKTRNEMRKNTKKSGSVGFQVSNHRGVGTTKKRTS